MPLKTHHSLSHGPGSAIKAPVVTAAENSTGVTLKGFKGFAGLIHFFKNMRAFHPKFTVTNRAAPDGGSTQAIRLHHSKKTPAIALERLAATVRAVAPNAFARASAARSASNPQPATNDQTTEASAIQRGRAELHVAIQKSTIDDQVQALQNGRTAPAEGLDQSIGELQKIRARELRNGLLEHIADGFSRVRELSAQAAAGLPHNPAEQTASALSESLALDLIRTLTPELASLDTEQEFNPYRERVVAEATKEIADHYRQLVEKGGGSAELLDALDTRAEFWANETHKSVLHYREKTAASQASTRADEFQGRWTQELESIGGTPEQQKAAIKLHYLKELLSDLVTLSDFRPAADPEITLEAKYGRSAEFKAAIGDRERTNGNSIESLRLKAHSEAVDELLRGNVQHRELALNLKLMGARDDQQRELVTLRHELQLAKENIFRIADDENRQIDSASAKSLKLDYVILDAWNAQGVDTKDINLLIGHAIALQFKLGTLERAYVNGLAERQAVVKEDLQAIGLSDKTLKQLGTQQDRLDGILKTAEELARKGLKNTQQVKEIRDQAATAFNRVLTGKLANLANKDLRSLTPRARLEVLGLMLDRSRSENNRKLLGEARIHQFMAEAQVPAAKDGQPSSEPAQQRYSELQGHLAREGDRLAGALTAETNAIESLASIQNLRISPDDKASLALAIQLRELDSLSIHRDFLVEAANRRDLDVDDQQAINKVMTDVEGQIRSLERSIRSAKGTLADRLLNSPETHLHSITGKLRETPGVAAAVDALTSIADARSQQKLSKEAILGLQAGMGQCLDMRKLAMGSLAHSALMVELRSAIAAEFHAELRERQFVGESLPDPMVFVPLDRKDAILARLESQGIAPEQFSSEIDDLLYREISPTDLEQWIKEAKAGAKLEENIQKTLAKDRGESTPKPVGISAENAQVVKTIANLQPGETFFLGTGYGIEATTGGLIPISPIAKVGFTAGVDRDYLFQVVREGDAIVLLVKNATTGSAKVGARAKYEVPGKIGAARANAEAGGAAKRGGGFEARFSSPEKLAQTIARFYETQGTDTAVLLTSADRVAQLSEFELNLRAQAGASIDFDLTEGIEIGGEEHHGETHHKSTKGQEAGGLFLGLNALAGVGWKRNRTVLSNNESITVSVSKTTDISANAAAALGIGIPTLSKALADLTDAENGNILGRQFASKATSYQEANAGPELLDVSVGIKNRKLVSELTFTRSARGAGFESGSRVYKIDAAKGMKFSALQKSLPALSAQLSAANLAQRCDEMFAKIDGGGHELAIEVRLKPSVLTDFNRQFTEARAALDLKKSRISAKEFVSESKALESTFIKRFEQLIDVEANVEPAGLTLTQMTPTERALSIDAMLVKVKASGKSGFGTQVDVITIPTAARSDILAEWQRVKPDALARAFAEGDARRDALLQRLNAQPASSGNPQSASAAPVPAPAPGSARAPASAPAPASALAPAVKKPADPILMGQTFFQASDAERREFLKTVDLPALLATGLGITFIDPTGIDVTARNRAINALVNKMIEITSNAHPDRKVSEATKLFLQSALEAQGKVLETKSLFDQAREVTSAELPLSLPTSSQNIKQFDIAIGQTRKEKLDQIQKIMKEHFAAESTPAVVPLLEPGHWVSIIGTKDSAGNIQYHVIDTQKSRNDFSDFEKDVSEILGENGRIGVDTSRYCGDYQQHAPSSCGPLNAIALRTIEDPAFGNNPLGALDEFFDKFEASSPREQKALVLNERLRMFDNLFDHSLSLQGK